MSASQSTQNIHASLRNTRINVQPDSRIVSVPVPAPAPLELGKYVQRFHDFLTHAGLQHKDYQTQGIQFCLRNEMRRGGGGGGGATAMDQTCVFGGIVADEMGLGKTIMMIGLTISNFKKRTLIVLPVALVKQWEQQILKTAGHHALVFYGPEKRKITPEMLAEAPIVITTYGHMIRRPNSHRLHHPLYALKWDRVIFDEAHHVRNAERQYPLVCHRNANSKLDSRPLCVVCASWTSRRVLCEQRQSARNRSNIRPQTHEKKRRAFIAAPDNKNHRREMGLAGRNDIVA